MSDDLSNIIHSLLVKNMARRLSTLLLLLVFLVICFISIVSGADVFESIDCGSSDFSYTDDNLITWSSDDDYVSNGVSQVVPNSNSMSPVMDTLRVFTSRKKNCYTIQVDPGVRVLVRASFYYGNYDRKSSPPSFDLQFDGNYWATVGTTNNSIVYYEVIYVVKGDSTSICLAQTNPGQFPFISALEIRGLASTMYVSVEATRALFLSRRVAYGATKTIRYMDDSYDRIWTPINGTVNGLIPVTNTDPSAIISEGVDNPPKEMLQNAITVENVSLVIRLGTSFPAADVPVYMNLYFSEVTQLGSTENRSFSLFQNTKSFQDSISPPFGNFLEYIVSNTTVSSNTTFFLVADSNSTLPPLINGMEVFFISDPLTNGTNRRDVEGLAALQNTFEVLREWGGDPCLPPSYSWDWVNCSNDATPRITALYLSSFGLSGLLPDISSMDSLETIDLHNNSLSGPIPDFLGSMPNLKQLNLGDNKLSGPIPASLSKKNNLNLVVTGNPDLCNSGNSCKSTPSGGGGSGSKKKSSSKLPLILGIAIPAFVLIWAIIGVFAILHFKRKSAAISAVTANAGQVGGGSAGNVGMAALKTFARDEADNTSSDNNATSSSATAN